jgi:DNA-binding MarR family transcriptional regulator
MTQALFRTLLAVWEEGGEGGIAPSVLADHLLLERATVTVLTTRLVERGLIARAPGENRRTFNLVLTQKGGETLSRLGPLAISLAEQTMEGITEPDLEQLYALLQRIEDRLRGTQTPLPSPADNEGAK